MRKILFRGKRLDNGEWLESHTIVSADDCVYMANGNYATGDYNNPDGVTVLRGEDGPFMIEVDPATVGRYTEATDVNFDSIFEGDIVKYPAISLPNEKIHFGCVSLSRGMWVIDWADGAVWIGRELFRGAARVKVVGNIYDNPELVEEAKRNAD